MSTDTHPLEHALLGFLRQQPRHGYAIHQALSDPAGLGPVWQVKLSRLYSLLGKLGDAGLVETTTEPQVNKPDRKIFHLTPAGERAFLAWVTQPVTEGRSLRLEFLVKLYFAQRESAATVSRLISAQRAECEAWLAHEQRAVSDATIESGRYGRLVHQFRLGQIAAMLDWLDGCALEDASHA